MFSLQLFAVNYEITSVKNEFVVLLSTDLSFVSLTKCTGSLENKIFDLMIQYLLCVSVQDCEFCKK